APPLPVEPQWGFDDAQIDAARQASVPVTWPVGEEEPAVAEELAAAAKPNRWIGALIGAVVIIALAFGGFAGWNWWQARQASQQASAVPVQPMKRAQLRPRSTAASTSTAPVPSTAGTPGIPAIAAGAAATTSIPG